MGEENTIPMRINKVEGVAGQVKISGGPGVLETWGAPAPAAHTHAAADVTSGQFPLTRMPRAATGNFLEGNGVGADPIFNALVEANIPNHMAKGKLAWTVNKLLKGAGAGVDPTEIDVPTGLTTMLKSHTRVLNAANGDVGYSGYGFQPKALIIFAADAGGIYSYFSWGLGDENLSEMCLSHAGFAWGRVHISRLLELWETATTTGAYCVLKTLDADGFTLTWTKAGAPGSTATLLVLALG